MVAESGVKGDISSVEHWIDNVVGCKEHARKLAAVRGQSLYTKWRCWRKDWQWKKTS